MQWSVIDFVENAGLVSKTAQCWLAWVILVGMAISPAFCGSVIQLEMKKGLAFGMPAVASIVSGVMRNMPASPSPTASATPPAR